MRIKRSVSRFFLNLILPAITLAVISYFGSYAIWGERGLLQLEDTDAKLGVAQAQLADVQGERDRLYHRIRLMDEGDPDLVQELARGQLMDAGPGQVAIPRSAH